MKRYMNPMFKFKLRKRYDKEKMNPTLLEKINRNNAEDRIEIGEIAEKGSNSQFGMLINLIVNLIIDEEIESSWQGNSAQADRVLGRIEGLNKLLDYINDCIIRRQELLKHRRDDTVIGVGNESIETMVGPQAE